mgnify:CR=1 FL=1
MSIVLGNRPNVYDFKQNLTVFEALRVLQNLRSLAWIEKDVKKHILNQILMQTQMRFAISSVGFHHTKKCKFSSKKNVIENL